MKFLITPALLLLSTAALALPKANSQWDGINITKPAAPENTCEISIENVDATDGRNFSRIRQGQFQFTVNGMVFNESLEQAPFEGSVIIDRSAGKLIYRGQFSHTVPQSRLNGAAARIQIETVGRVITHISIDRPGLNGELAYSNGCSSIKLSDKK